MATVRHFLVNDTKSFWFQGKCSLISETFTCFRCEKLILCWVLTNQNRNFHSKIEINRNLIYGCVAKILVCMFWLLIDTVSDDFPAPVLPTIPIISPPAISQSIPFTTKSKPSRYLWNEIFFFFFVTRFGRIGLTNYFGHCFIPLWLYLLSIPTLLNFAV